MQHDRVALARQAYDFAYTVLRLADVPAPTDVSYYDELLSAVDQKTQLACQLRKAEHARAASRVLVTSLRTQLAQLQARAPRPAPALAVYAYYREHEE